MWTRTGGQYLSTWTPNHFVTLLEKDTENIVPEEEGGLKDDSNDLPGTRHCLQN